jgi:hypothetical protein
MTIDISLKDWILQITGIEIWKQKTIGRRNQNNSPQPVHTTPNTPSVESDFLITENGNFLITENDNFLITE